MIIKVTANGSTQNAVLTTPPTVSSFRNTHGAAYGVTGNTVVKVNGVAASDSQVLQDGDHVTFHQATSQKAASYSVTIQANGGSSALMLDSVKTANQLLADQSVRTAYGINTNTSVTVNGGSKSADSALTAGDVVSFTQRTSEKAA
jgi:ribosomal 50S subunit-recycling heat shock protein